MQKIRCCTRGGKPIWPDFLQVPIRLRSCFLWLVTPCTTIQSNSNFRVDDWMLSISKKCKVPLDYKAVSNQTCIVMWLHSNSRMKKMTDIDVPPKRITMLQNPASSARSRNDSSTLLLACLWSPVLNEFLDPTHLATLLRSCMDCKKLVWMYEDNLTNAIFLITLIE